MRNLFDRAFFRVLLGFLLILAVGFSILIIVNAYREVHDNVAALLEAPAARAPAAPPLP